jgi:hypothetical protein
VNTLAHIKIKNMMLYIERKVLGIVKRSGVSLKLIYVPIFSAVQPDPSNNGKMHIVLGPSIKNIDTEAMKKDVLAKAILFLRIANMSLS